MLVARLVKCLEQNLDWKVFSTSNLPWNVVENMILHLSDRLYMANTNPKGIS